MAKAPSTAALVTLSLRAAKETKGTYVYTMVNENGIEIGGIYLQKLLFKAKPADKLKMVIGDADPE